MYATFCRFLYIFFLIFFGLYILFLINSKTIFRCQRFALYVFYIKVFFLNLIINFFFSHYLIFFFFRIIRELGFFTCLLFRNSAIIFGFRLFYFITNKKRKNKPDYQIFVNIFFLFFIIFFLPRHPAPQHFYYLYIIIFLLITLQYYIYILLSHYNININILDINFLFTPFQYFNTNKTPCFFFFNAHFYLLNFCPTL